ncbi:hypothetical protein HMPREF0541_00986 [Lacticaseibacillus rhamnosus ATCC 21052]|nr:hypothetical protein HMPREF0541_00986 [Lacticaseibacillus rhamnosus ATCC 21052]
MAKELKQAAIADLLKMRWPLFSYFKDKYQSQKIPPNIYDMIRKIQSPQSKFNYN